MIVEQRDFLHVEELLPPALLDDGLVFQRLPGLHHAQVVRAVFLCFLGRKQIGVSAPDHFIGRAGIELVPVDAEHGKLACSAFTRFGKGRHRAGLNYGDCVAYALAISAGEPLLFKGDDFVHTDVTLVDLPPG